MQRAFLRSPRVRGFTLVELMVVVLIMGILAVIGGTLFRRHVQSSKSVEALAMLRSIASAQERYRSEHLTYLNVSSSLESYYPVGKEELGQVRYHWERSSGNDYANWKQLAPTVPGPVQYGYATVAGLPGTSLPAATISGTAVTWPTQVVQPWYIIQAEADLDGNGVYSKLLTSSFNATVLRENEGE